MLVSEVPDDTMKHIWTSLDHQVMIAFAILLPTAKEFFLGGGDYRYAFLRPFGGSW